MKNLTNLRKSVLTVLAVLISGIAFSQFTRQQAISLVMNNIVGADSLSINVFAALDSRTQQQSVVLFDNRTVSCAYSNNWVFFIDDNRNAFWCHACRYVFVSGQTGNYTIVNQDMFPVDLETTYQLITTIPTSWQITVPDYTGSSVTLDAPNDHLFAVLVGGTQQTAFWTNISMIYNTLLEKGYKKENIFVHFSNADGSYGNGLYDDDLDGDLVLDDIDYEASLASLQTTFDNLSGVSISNPEIPKLQHGDQLLVHFDSHGYSYNSFNMGAKLLLEGNNFEYLFDYQLAEWMELIDCAQMLITMQQCFSGGFIDDLTDYITYPGTLCKNRLVITAADYDEPAVMEAHITGGNSIIFGGVYGEFDFYFYSALRGFYPDVDETGGGFFPWEISAELGDFPFYQYPTMINHPLDYDPDEVLGNDDGIVQVGEGFLYMDDFDTWSSNGYYMPFPPYSYVEHPQYVKTGLFIEDLFTLTGLTGEVGNNQTVTGNFLIGGNITIKSTADVNITNASEFYFQDANSRIYIRGELNIGEDVLLKGQGDNLLSLVRTETNGTITIGSGTEFNHMRLELTSYPLQDYLLMDDLAFINSDINGQVESIDVLNSDFTNTWMQISHCDDFYMEGCNFNYSSLMVLGNTFSPILSTAIISDCNFINNNASSDAVWIEHMPKYSFSGNTINGYVSGLAVFYSGEGNMAEISNNEIYNNSENGIAIYNSHAYMRINNIRDNGEDGISLHNSSYVTLVGNQAAKYVSQTQRFRDNGMYEIFSDQYSFPTTFRWNAVIDENNELDGYELVYCETAQSTEKDVSYNYWGSNENFHPVNDLYPSWDYTYLPKFKLLDDEDESSSDELLFNTAENEFEQGNYSAAKSVYQQVVEQFPGSKFANASIKQLFSVEAFADNDFAVLKQYFRANNIILNSEELENLADFLANKCDIKLENWQTAIDWFENKILNPVSFEDSLYSVIDLGNTYLLMEQSGFKSAYNGNLTEHIPASVEQYTTKRDYLISLLPQDKASDQIKFNLAKLYWGELLQNVPNPFNGTTQIWFKLTEESNVSVTIYDYTGKEVSVINPGLLATGNHSIEFNSAYLSSGIYFYSLEVNGIKTDTKKMTLMK